MLAANTLEAAIVVDAARSPIDTRRFDEAVTEAGIVIEPATREQAETARAANRAAPASVDLGTLPALDRHSQRQQ